MSAFGGKADMTFFSARMSAFDPKRTLIAPLGHSILPLRCLVMTLGGGGETARVHHTSQRHGGHIADCQLGAATRTGCAGRCAHEYGCEVGLCRQELSFWVVYQKYNSQMIVHSFGS